MFILLQLQDLSLKPGEQGSLRYKFRPDPMLQPREFLVTLHVFYNARAWPCSVLTHLCVDACLLPSK